MCVFGFSRVSDARSGSERPEKATKVRTQLAVEYLRTGDLDAAKRALDQALETTPRDSQANMMMGVLLQQEGSKLNLEKQIIISSARFRPIRKMRRREIITAPIYISLNAIMMRSSSFKLLVPRWVMISDSAHWKIWGGFT